MAQGADIIAIQETWKSSEQIASMHTGDYVLYAQSRIGKGGGVAVWCGKLSAPSVYLSQSPDEPSLEVVVVQVALDQKRDLIVAECLYETTTASNAIPSARLVNCLPSLDDRSCCAGDFNMHHPTVGAILGDFSKRCCCRIFRTVHGCGTHLG
ncbi:putative Endonuclease-reverse transcriptase [Trypanosoma cruzi]|nr:putative Endonuclease-reverse transcriptase [Trypanosoma cruzi]